MDEFRTWLLSPESSLIIEKYTSLSFDIFVWEPSNDWGYILKSLYGHYTKCVFESLEFKDLDKCKYKVFHYKKDFLRNTTQVIKEKIYSGSESHVPPPSSSERNGLFISDDFDIFSDDGDDPLKENDIINTFSLPPLR